MFARSRPYAAVRSALITSFIFGVPVFLAGLRPEVGTIEIEPRTPRYAHAVIFTVPELADATVGEWESDGLAEGVVAEEPAELTEPLPVEPVPVEPPPVEPPPVDESAPEPEPEIAPEAAEKFAALADLAADPNTDNTADLTGGAVGTPLPPGSQFGVERIVRKLPRKATRTKAKVKECLPPIDEIVKIDDAQWRIDRDLVDYYVKHLDEAEKLAWIGWHRDEAGDIDGFKIKRIRCGSVLDQAGFKNGDVVLEINGRPVTSIPQAIGAYYRLRTKRNLRVDLAREGETVRLKYKLS